MTLLPDYNQIGEKNMECVKNEKDFVWETIINESKLLEKDTDTSYKKRTGSYYTDFELTDLTTNIPLWTIIKTYLIII